MGRDNKQIFSDMGYWIKHKMSREILLQIDNNLKIIIVIQVLLRTYFY